MRAVCCQNWYIVVISSDPSVPLRNFRKFKSGPVYLYRLRVVFNTVEEFQSCNIMVESFNCYVVFAGESYVAVESFTTTALYFNTRQSSVYCDRVRALSLKLRKFFDYMI
jgi:hypothetical protein